MSYGVVHDPDAQRAVLFCSTSEEPLRHRAFIGAAAREEADSFLAFLLADRVQREDGDLHGPAVGFFSHRAVYPDPTDPRWYTYDGLERARTQWEEACLDSDGRLNDYGWALYEWFQTSRRDPAPEMALAKLAPGELDPRD